MIEALQDYAREHAPHTAAPERIAYAIEALVPYWSKSMVGDITRETCRGYVRYRGKSDGTMRRELTVLRAAVNYAHQEGRLTRAPHVDLPAPPPHKDRWLTRSEAAALLWVSRKDARCRLYLPLFILLGLYTGARKEAILSLRWVQVDLERGRIDFNPPGRRQTNKRRSIIPIPRGLFWFLRKARERGSDLGYVVNRDGMRVGDIKKSFATAAIAAGMYEVERRKTAEGEEREVRKAAISPHTLRHTAGTWMAQAGVDLWKIAGWLGHSQARTTELYAHHHPDFLISAREALD